MQQVISLFQLKIKSFFLITRIIFFTQEVWTILETKNPLIFNWNKLITCCMAMLRLRPTASYTMEAARGHNVVSLLVAIERFLTWWVSYLRGHPCITYAHFQTFLTPSFHVSKAILGNHAILTAPISSTHSFYRQKICSVGSGCSFWFIVIKAQ